jgi:tRNA-specific 2-thiouridylase
MDYFLKSYAAGCTPNPCIFCNPAIKFGKLLQKMKEFKCDKLATGHYAQIKKSGSIYRLFRGADEDKDQSYFLCRLTQSRLKHTLFPLGAKKKTDVRRLAKKFGFTFQEEKKESAGACFLSDTEPSDYLKKNLPKKFLRPGEIKTWDGKVIGQHSGLSLYTIGQRRGVELGGLPEPYYVLKLERKKNELIVGPNEKLFASKLKVKQLNWIGTAPKNNSKLLAQIRYRTPATPGIIKFNKPGSPPDKGGRGGVGVNFTFTTPIRAITPGQAVVFYHGAKCLGGGIIS